MKTKKCRKLDHIIGIKHDKLSQLLWLMSVRDAREYGDVQVVFNCCPRCGDPVSDIKFQVKINMHPND